VRRPPEAGNLFEVLDYDQTTAIA